MGDNKKLSVIIPVYGTEQYIEKCIISALKATEGIDAEILVVNDGTKDNAGKIAQQYEAQHPERIVYLEKENGGLADTKNFGLEHSNGEFVTFLDSDDFIEPEMYKEMLELADAENADCVVCDMIYDYENDGHQTYQRCACGREDMYHKLVDTPLMASSCNKIMKRELFDGLAFPKGKNNEDIAVTPIAMGKSNNLAYLPKGFYHYLQRSGSIQNSSFSRKRFVILDACALTMERSKELSAERIEMLKGAVYVHQVLAVPFYLIRREPLIRRYPLLRDYMKRVDELFPDFHDNQEIHEYGTWGGNKITNTYRKMSLWLVNKKMYLLLSVLWTIVKPFINE